jgi:hypothetical protein
VRNPSAAAEEKIRAEQKRVRDATKEARALLSKLCIVFWGDLPTNDRKRDLEAAVSFLDNLINDPVADHLPGIAVARKVVLPILKQAQPSKQLRGKPAVLFSARNQLIAEVVSIISERYGLDPTGNPASRDKGRSCGCSVVSEALRQLGITLSESSIASIWKKFRK